MRYVKCEKNHRPIVRQLSNLEEFKNFKVQTKKFCFLKMPPSPALGGGFLGR